MKRILALLLTLIVSCQAVPAHGQKYIDDIASFLNGQTQTIFPASLLRYHFITTPIRIELDGSYQIIENDNGFSYCPGTLKLTPKTANIYTLDSFTYVDGAMPYEDVTFYAFTIDYTCRSVAGKGVFYIIFLEHLENDVEIFFLDLDYNSFYSYLLYLERQAALIN